MTDQDQVNERNCCLIIKGANLTARMLALAMRAFLYEGKAARQNLSIGQGKQTLRQLSKSGGKLENIEVGEDVKSFEGIARKYGVDFAVKRDVSSDTPRYLVFFKSKDSASMELAFRDYIARELKRSKEKPPLSKTMDQMAEKVKHQVPNVERHKERER